MARANSGKGVGLWPKLLLWGVVILAAVFYLRYINEKGAEEKPGAGSKIAQEIAKYLRSRSSERGLRRGNDQGRRDPSSSGVARLAP